MPDYTGYSTLQVSVQDKIATVLLNRPPVNAWTATMSDELVDAYTKFDQDDGVHVVVLSAKGKIFCAGAELGKGFQQAHPLEARDTGGRATVAIFKCRKVTIAALQGSAVGIGITLTLPMDIRITHKANKVGFVFARRGISTEAASSYFLPKLVGMSTTMALLTTAQVLPASHEWLRPLFAVQTDRADEVLPAALAMARDVAKHCSVVSHAINKTLVWAMKDSPEAAHIADSLSILTTQRDGGEGGRAFMEKRDPVFTDSVQAPLIDGYLRVIRGKL